MGASGWHYFTDYQADPGAALQKLRREVFEKGEYGETRNWEEMVKGMEAAGMDVKQLKVILQQRQQMDAARALAKPRTIEEALDQAAEEGTHSILDIMAGVSKVPQFGTAFPAPDAWLMQAYGTTRPTRAQVEGAGFEPAEELERWSAVFFPVAETKEGPPRWWYFEGCSGD